MDNKNKIVEILSNEALIMETENRTDYYIDNVQEIAEEIVKLFAIPVVVGRSEQLSCATCEYGKFTTHKVCTTCFARDKHVPAT
ncbi:MAG: hypothetical protein HN347_16200 [Bacteroidetes bacterium]|jgi:hypothetical protein|nr:hypothetical protein [Bacteroidota bacterium]